MGVGGVEDGVDLAGDVFGDAEADERKLALVGVRVERGVEVFVCVVEAVDVSVRSVVANFARLQLSERVGMSS